MVASKSVAVSLFVCAQPLIISVWNTLHLFFVGTLAVVPWALIKLLLLHLLCQSALAAAGDDNRRTRLAITQLAVEFDVVLSLWIGAFLRSPFIRPLFREKPS